MNAERLLTQFDRLTDVQDAVPRLRRFILDLVVRGKLVEQDPNDEPASELLKRIQAERAISRSRRTPLNTKLTELVPRKGLSSKLPANWVATTAGALLTFITSGSRGWAEYYSNDGPIFLRLGNLDYGTIDLDLSNIQHVTPPKGAEGTRTKVQENDLLVSMTGDIGMIGLIPAGFPEAYINQHIGLARPSNFICSRYLATIFYSPWGVSQLKGLQRGIKNSLGLDDIRSIVVALPPLAEQHRIVAKVDELMALCDRLEAVLRECETLRRRLLEAVLHDTLNGNLLPQGRDVTSKCR